MHLESEKDRNITKRVGNTPLIKLEKLFGQHEVYAKLEWCNPSGSLKARPAAWMLHDSEKDGKIIPNKTTIIEPTSGNTGVALSYFAKELGYKIDLTVPERISDETKKILKDQGANVMETEDDLCPRVGPGTDQAIALADALLKMITEYKSYQNKCLSAANEYFNYRKNVDGYKAVLLGDKIN